MRRLVILGFALLAVSAIGTGTATAASVPSTETFGFETDFEGWQPATDGGTAGWDASRSTERAHAGDYAVRFWINGGTDDGTVWVQRPFDTEQFGTVRVTVSFWLWTQGASTFSAWPVVAYVGEQPPTVEADFARIGRTDKPGWQRFSYTTLVTPFATGVVWVAVGTSVTWEIVRTSFLDDVTVTVEPPFPTG